MADKDGGILAEFEEWLNAKREAEQNTPENDDEVEVWDEKGRGARVKRSLAKPFLQSLGIDVDPEPDPEPGDGDNGGKTPAKRNPGPTRKNPPAATGGTARKYFVKAPAK